MATLYISEFRCEIRNGAPCAIQPALVDQTVAIGVSAASSSPFQPATEMVQLSTDAVCSILFGGSAATQSNARLPANCIIYYAVNGGDSVSVIANT